MRIRFTLGGAKSWMRTVAAALSFVAAFVIGFDVWAAPGSETSEIAALTAPLEGRDRIVHDFYQARNYQLAWRGPDIGVLNTSLANAAAEGLEPKDYLPIAEGSDAERDVAMTRAALAYLRDLRQGRETLRLVDSDIALPHETFDAVKAVDGALKTNRVAELFSSVTPTILDYARLKEALANYRAIASRGGWPVLEFPGSGVGRPTDRQARALHDRLIFEDEILARESSADIGSALKRFQARHGLKADGYANKGTIAELNVTAAERGNQIVANLERLRWMPRQLEPNYILVNVPDAHLSLVLGGKEVLASRVIVGKPATPTPILRAEGGGITVNPPWNVPASIARNEILPKLKKNHSYLKTQDMVLLNGPLGDPYGLTVRWGAIPKGTFPYLVQQHPGRQNPLGTVKLELPNRFDVYLHDTPLKGAFARSSRDLSHGCVRVERILPLASYAMNQSLDDMIAIMDAISGGETRFLPLRRQLPVCFIYQTAFFDAKDQLQFRPDIYGRDRRMMAMLEGGTSAIEGPRVACASGGARKG